MINDPVESEATRRFVSVQGRTACPERAPRVLTEAEIGDVIQSYRSGTTARELAEQYGVHTSTVKKKLRKYGVRRSA